MTVVCLFQCDLYSLGLVIFEMYQPLLVIVMYVTIVCLFQCDLYSLGLVIFEMYQPLLVIVMYVTIVCLFQCDLYSLGLVIFEMYQPFRTEMERVSSLRALRRGVIPDTFTERWPPQVRGEGNQRATSGQPAGNQRVETGTGNKQEHSGK